MHAKKTLNPTKSFIEGANAVPIAVWDHGGSGSPLILVHCTGTHARIWDPLVPGLLERYHVYAIGTRGHGDSGQPQEPEAYSWSYSALDLLAVLEALELTSGILTVGHSAGATHICNASLLKPQYFGRTVLIDPIIGPMMPISGENPMAAATRRRINVFESRQAARERFASKPPMDTWHPDALDAYVDHAFNDRPDGTVQLKCPGTIEAHFYDHGGRSDLFDRLGEIQLESLLVTSDGSNVRPMVDLQKERLKNCQFHIVEDASHFIPQEKPQEIVQLILDWFNSVE